MKIHSAIITVLLPALTMLLIACSGGSPISKMPVSEPEVMDKAIVDPTFTNKPLNPKAAEPPVLEPNPTKGPTTALAAVKPTEVTPTPAQMPPVVTPTTVPTTQHTTVHRRRTHLVITLNGPFLAETRAQLREQGIELLNPLGGAQWIASAETGLDDKLESIELVSEAEEILPSDKLSEDILDESAPFDYQEREGDRIAYSAMLHRDATISEIDMMVKELDALLEDFDPYAFPTVRTITLSLPKGSLELLARQDIVAWIEPAQPPLAGHNRDSGRPFSNVDIVQTDPYGLDGTGIIVGVWDEGPIDINHPDLKPRVEMAPDQIRATSDHAMHVVGTIGSSGINVPAAGGMAPNVSIRVWDWDNKFNEIREAAEETDPQSAIRISNHSYGPRIGYTLSNDRRRWIYRDNRSLFGKYTTDSETLDSIVKDTDHIVFKAAMNHRTEGGQDPPRGSDCRSWSLARTGPSESSSIEQGYDCIDPPGSAKNIITIGAAYRTTPDTDEEEWPADFSSFGPTDDGRIKPDLVAHGVNIISLANDTYVDGVSMSGTSMASPAAAGIGALILQEADNLGIPISAAGMKSLLIQTARDIPSFEQEETFRGPDFRTGWGAVDAKAAIDLLRVGSLEQGTLTLPSAEDIVWVDGQVSKVRGAFRDESNIEDPLPADSWFREFEVLEPLEEIHVTLAWTDPPSSPGTSTPVLIHDLDLRLISPDGQVYKPWSLLDEFAPHQDIRERLHKRERLTFSPDNRWFGGPSREGGDDYINNVEQVSVLDPVIGHWVIKVTVPLRFAVNRQGRWRDLAAGGGDGRGGLTTESQNFTIASDIPISSDIGDYWVPGIPTNVSAMAGDGQATVTWTAPSLEGGPPITSYRITVSPGGHSVIVDGSNLEATVTGLTNGTDYTFTVTAVNLVSYGDPSNPSNVATPATVPGIPTNVSAMAGDGQATVTWTAPSSDGGSTVTGYTVTVNPGDRIITVDGSNLEATVTGLANGTDYTFTVTAANLVGYGDFSDPSNVAKPATVPGAPTIDYVVLHQGGSGATVTWTAPSSDGGSAVTGYTISVNPGDRIITVDGSNLEATVRDLANWTEYTFTITARNRLGNGDASNPTSTLIFPPNSVPGIPTIESVTVGDGQATVTWTASFTHERYPVRMYRVRVAHSSGPPDLWAYREDGSLTATFTGLINGEDYIFTVSANNLIGYGEPSDPVVATLPATDQLKLWSWGDNGSGRLGDGTSVDRQVPTQISSNMWQVVAAGRAHSMAISTDGSLWGWGDNHDGQLGDGTIKDRYNPVQIGLDTSWRLLATGAAHNAATQLDGSLWTWGNNGSGRLGDGTATNRDTPARIGTESWIAVTAGAMHTAAIKADGTLSTWGHSANGRLGHDIRQEHKPVQVGLDTWEAVAAGSSHTVGIKSNGTLWAWGSNAYGQLGIGTTEDRDIPTKVGSDIWLSVAAGDGFTLAIRADGTLWSWGRNRWGQLGSGITIDHHVPKQIGSATWTAIGGGRQHSVAIKSDGTLWAWGRNNLEGRLGDGTNEDRYSPIQIGSGTWAAISVGYWHTIAIAAGSLD